LGTTFGTAAELRLGAYWGNRNLAVDTGSRVLPEGGLQDSGMRLRLLFDTLDSGYVPRDGHRLVLDYQRPLRAFGADIEYQRLYTSWQGAYSLGADSLVGTLRGGSGLGGLIPYYDQFALGGFLNLAGYANEQFRGSEMVYGSLVYYRRIAALTPPLGRGLYVGGSLEAGQLWNGAAFVESDAAPVTLAPEQLRYGASLFFGADTWLGPFYLGWGLSGTGSNSLYVLLGQP
jgi:NTE family protein